MTGPQNLRGEPDPPRGTWIDLIAVAVLTAASCGVVLWWGEPGSLPRIALGIPLLAALPGYAFVAALFPRRESPTPGEDVESIDEGMADESAAKHANRRIDGIERAALTVGMSVALVSLLGFALHFTRWGIRLVPIVAAVGGFTLLATVVAAVRRARADPDERFGVPYRGWLVAARSGTIGAQSRADAALNVLMALGVLVAMSSVVYAVGAPTGETQTGESELYILTENEDGELVAEDYPETVDDVQEEPLHVRVTNDEGETVEYTLVARIERVSETADGELRVEESERLHEFEPTLDHGEQWETLHSPTPELSGDDLRLTYLLYEGEPPADGELSPDDAYRSVTLPLDG